MIKNYLSILAENGELILAEIAVAPLVGAWIETYLYLHVPVKALSRSPRGSVD